MKAWLPIALGLIAASGLVVVAIGTLIQWRDLTLAGFAISMAVFLGCFITFLMVFVLGEWDNYRDRVTSRH